MKSGMRQNKTLKVEKLEIEKNYEKLDERPAEDLDTIYSGINSKIVYEITSDENLLEFIQNEDEYTYYYLNDEQYEILNCEFPLFLKGSAGSGKTTVAIRKTMELEERQDLKVGYITFTQPLKEKAHEMYEKFRYPGCEKMVEFYSLEELYEKQLREKPTGLKIFEKMEEVRAVIGDRCNIELVAFDVSASIGPRQRQGRIMEIRCRKDVDPVGL